jgi:uncharacterized protein YlxW (UPF0749 family)
MEKKMKMFIQIKTLMCVFLFTFLIGNVNIEASDANHLLVTAIQVLSEENNDLQARIFKLEKRIAELEKLSKEHIEKPHLFYGEKNRYNGYFYIEENNEKVQVTHN